jgi:exodeoxyribonuclease-3
MAKTANSRPLRIATWNINSVRVRLANVARFVAEYQPDVLCLQETKVADEAFPDAALAEMGFPHRCFKGDKGYNGVAILSKVPFTEKRVERFGGKDHARHLAVTLEGGVELHDFYVPAGGDLPDPEKNEKFAHKLKFVADMTEWCQKRRDPSARRILVGDLNIAPLEHDVWSHKQLLKVVSHTPVEVEALGKLKTSGDWVDSARRFVPEEKKLYSWWSYRSPDWAKADKGRRLDHIWVSPSLADGLKAVETPRDPRGWQVASDHVPVIATIAL